MTLVRELLDLPASVSKGDFVQVLTDGVADPTRTVATYAVTPELVDSFDRALGLVGTALSTGSSIPVYLDGSFGSGKSHFMAILDLMLQGHPAPWSKPEFHALRAKHTFVDKARVLQIPVHMLGSQSFESKVFGAYVTHVRSHHPGADLPLLFADGPVFDNAQGLREQVGDTAFFARLNEGASDAMPSFFGAAAATTGAWDAARFEAARKSPDPAVRAELFTRLTDTWLSAYAQTTSQWVTADQGWNEMSRHAQTLGYQGVVLYLDEMILWLMGMLSDPTAMSAEFEKLVQIKESQHNDRPVPIVVFVARQRRPENLVDATLVGKERATVFENMAHHEGRFDRVELNDSTLRAIIPHRVVKARTDADRARLDGAFAKVWSTSADAHTYLAAGTAAEQDFKQVYPFTPALVDVLIALSDQLQRERTAVRILVEFLVEHASDLQLGDYVPVGDVFDLIAGGEDAFDRAAQSAFQRARNLYLEKILPLLQAWNQVDETTCQRLRPGHTIRIGCSGCPVAACRRDNRMIKTVLLAALAPNTRALADLTVRKLVHLNHGVFGTSHEDMQVAKATARLRKLAAEVSQVRLEGEGDPTVKVSLESVDVGPILERAESYDTRQRRRVLLRRLLWEELGLPGEDALVVLPHDYLHTRRPGTIRFGNVRTMPDGDFRCPDTSEWQLVIDYPFDDQGFTPQDDENQLASVRQRLGNQAAHTLVWLPTFFSDKAASDLGDLCKLDHLLSGSNLTAALTHVPPDEHARARTDLEALATRKRTDLKDALAAAYGLRSGPTTEHFLDSSREPSTHLLALDDGLEPRNPRELQAGKAVTQLADQLLEHRYPEHPPFQSQLTPGKAVKLVEILQRLVDAPGTHDVGGDEEKLLRDLGTPLGLCKVFKLKAELVLRTIQRLEQERAKAGEDEPSVAQLRAWQDPLGHKGLTELAADVVSWIWAAHHKRVLVDNGDSVLWPVNGKLPPQGQFISPTLPSQLDFETATQRAGQIFGIASPGKVLKVQNVTALAKALRDLTNKPDAAWIAATPDKLAPRLTKWCTTAAPRAQTAEVAAALLDVCRTPDATQRITAFATLPLQGTSPTALQRAVQHASEVHAALVGDAWFTLDLLTTIAPDDPKRGSAEALIAQVGEALALDEINKALAPALRSLVQETARLLKGPGPTPPTGWDTRYKASETVSGTEALARLDALRSALADALASTTEETRMTVSLRLEERKKP